MNTIPDYSGNMNTIPDYSDNMNTIPDYSDNMNTIPDYSGNMNTPVAFLSNISKGTSLIATKKTFIFYFINTSHPSISVYLSLPLSRQALK
jgi:hypothetical protein